jgi:long-chain acyl-CoA synthetase
MKSYISRFTEVLDSGLNPSITFGSVYYEVDDIIREINRYTQFLASKGVNDRTRVAIISQNHPHFMFALFGALSIGAIPVLIEDSQDEATLQGLVKDETLVLIDRKHDLLHSNIVTFDEIEASTRASGDAVLANRFPDVDSDRTVMILHSSGTTGLPKKVHYSESNIDWAMSEYSMLYGITKQDVVAYMIPANCCLGVIACCLLPMLYGAEVAMILEDNLDEALESMARNKVTILPATPYLYKYMIRKDLRSYDFTSLRLCDSGGEILPVSVIKKFKEGAGVVITEGYGQTETTSLTHFLVSDASGELRLGSIGRPCTGVECRIVDPAGHDLGLLEVGELLIRGPMVTKGYDDAELQAEALDSKGYFKSGDLVYRDEDDFYYLVSRKKDLRGEKPEYAVLLRRIEEYVYSMDEVVEATVLMDSETLLQILIKPATREPNVLDALRSQIESMSWSPLQVEHVHFVERIPRTATGKVRKTLLQ